MSHLATTNSNTHYNNYDKRSTKTEMMMITCGECGRLVPEINLEIHSCYQRNGNHAQEEEDEGGIVLTDSSASRSNSHIKMSDSYEESTASFGSSAAAVASITADSTGGTTITTVTSPISTIYSSSNNHHLGSSTRNDRVASTRCRPLSYTYDNVNSTDDGRRLRRSEPHDIAADHQPPSSFTSRLRQRRHRHSANSSSDMDNNANNDRPRGYFRSITSSRSHNNRTCHNARVDPPGLRDKHIENECSNEEDQTPQEIHEEEEHEVSEQEQWSCPRCTLLNSKLHGQCDACNFRNPETAQNNPIPTAPRPQIATPIETAAAHAAASGRRVRSAAEEEAFNNGIRNRINNSSSTQMPTLYGAILGSVLGAAGAYARGRPMSTGVLEGAMSGAVGGALLQEVLRPPQSEERSNEEGEPHAETNGSTSLYEVEVPPSSSLRNELISTSRSAVAMGQPGYPAIASSANENIYNRYLVTVDEDENEINDRQQQQQQQQQQPRPSFRVSRRRVRDPHDYTTTVISSDMGTGVGDGNAVSQPRLRQMLHHDLHPGSRNNPLSVEEDDHATYDPLLTYMLRSMLSGSTAGFFPTVDNMNYEQLLSAFGDGTENLAAEERDIQSLPTAIIKNPLRQLPEDARSCAICLEGYEKGDVRKALPCLHGFHEECVNKWLRTNGACPVCKHRLNE